VGRARDGAKRGSRVTVVRLAPPAVDPAVRRAKALDWLGVLVDLYDRGLREPLPLYCKTSAAWAEAAGNPRKGPEASAAAVWDSGYNRNGENADLEHLLVLGGAVPFGAVLDVPAGKCEDGEGWFTAEPSRFGRYATRLWEPLLACEEVTDR